MSARSATVPRKKNLVLIRAGDSSLHEGWLAPRVKRNWDVAVSYFGDDPRRFRTSRGESIPRFDVKGPKYAPLHALLTSRALDWRGYDYLWIPDDDLETDCDTINRMFELCAQHRLALAQPALSLGSYLSHVITWQHSAFQVRFTTFIEMMAPIFSAAFLQKCLPTFVELPGVASGIEFLWLSKLSRRDRCAILDATPVRHTRPVGGGRSELYAELPKGWMSANQQFSNSWSKYQWSLNNLINLAAIDLEGHPISLRENSDLFMGKLVRSLAPFLSDPEALAQFYQVIPDVSEYVVAHLRCLLQHADVRDGIVPRESLIRKWRPKSGGARKGRTKRW